MELAKTKGKAHPDKGRFMIDIGVGAERHTPRHLPVVGGEM